MSNSFDALATLEVGSRKYRYFRLDASADKGFDTTRLPFSLKILLENLLRNEDGLTVTADDIEGLASWDPKADPSREIAFRPSRVLLQDFTGVPAVVDLAAMRAAMKALGGEPTRINPLQPVELVIDHSVQVDEAGTVNAFQVNADLEFDRNKERYAFLRWGQDAFDNFKVVPPDTGIVHQVNLEYLARVVFTAEANGQTTAYPDTLVGTDSHTTMINGLGVLGWGVGGIEAEAAMLGQPVSMLVPQVVGFKLAGKLREGATATDLVLTVTEMLRKTRRRRQVRRILRPRPGRTAPGRPRHHRQHGPRIWRNLRHLPRRRRNPPLPQAQRPPARAHRPGRSLLPGPGHVPRLERPPKPSTPTTLALDLADVVPSLAGPKRPQDRVPLSRLQSLLAGRPQVHPLSPPRQES